MRSVVLLVLLGFVSPLWAQLLPWDIETTYNVTGGQLALEIQAGPLSDGPDPTFGIVVLFNHPVNGNTLVALADDPPYFDNDFTATTLPTSPSIFSLGDICAGPDNAVIPVVEDLNVKTFQWADVTNWDDGTTVPGTTTPNFYTSDCVSNDNGFFVAGYDGQVNGLGVFRSTNQGGSWGLLANVTHPQGIVTPHPNEGFCGSRDAWIYDPASNNLIATFQVQNGDQLFQEMDSTSGVPGAANVFDPFPPPPGCNPFVLRESDVNVIRVGTETHIVGINSDGVNHTGFRARTGGGPPDIDTTLLSPVGSGGAFGFQGTSVSPWMEQPDPDPSAAQMAIGMLEEAGWVWDADAAAFVDPDYPGQGLGGPVESCTREELYREIEDAFFGPDNPQELISIFALTNGGVRVASRPIGDSLFRSSFSDFTVEVDWNCDKPYLWP